MHINITVKLYVYANLYESVNVLKHDRRVNIFINFLMPDTSEILIFSAFFVLFLYYFSYLIKSKPY